MGSQINDVKSSVAIVGAGSQGRRLAYMWASQGDDVHIVDQQPSQLEATLQAVDHFRSELAPKDQHGNVVTHLAESLETALKDAWLVVECVPERIGLKQQVISQLDKLASRDTIIASNSSSYSCFEIIDGLDLKHPGRVLSAHTYWPPETCEIEIMGHEQTDATSIEIMMKQCARHGFSPFHVKSQSIGYIYNRIWAAIKREALLAAAEGAGRPEEIDAVFKGVLKTPKGPFELMDVVGLDVVLDIEKHYAATRKNLPKEPQEYLDKFLQKGYLGVKSGRGFYDYGGSPVV